MLQSHRYAYLTVTTQLSIKALGERDPFTSSRPPFFRRLVWIIYGPLPFLVSRPPSRASRARGRVKVGGTAGDKRRGLSGRTEKGDEDLFHNSADTRRGSSMRCSLEHTRQVRCERSSLIAALRRTHVVAPWVRSLRSRAQRCRGDSLLCYKPRLGAMANILRASLAAPLLVGWRPATVAHS